MTKGKGRTPGAGGLDKHIKRTAHKERSQPAARKHLGALEKHKDYTRRSKRRHTKQTKLQEVKRAAAQRNPDEFNIGMTKAVMDVASGKMKRKSSTSEENNKAKVKIISENAASARYLERKAYDDIHRAQELLEDTVGLDAKPVNVHTVFVDCDEEFTHFNAAKRFNTLPELLQYPATRANLTHMAETVSAEALLESAHAVLSKAQQRLKKKPKKVVVAGEPAENDDDSGAETEGRIILSHKEKLQIAKNDALRKVKEISQRFKRSKDLVQIAKGIRNQSAGLSKALKTKELRRYRRGATIRAR